PTPPQPPTTLPIALTSHRCGVLLGFLFIAALFVAEYAFGWITVVGTELSVSGLAGTLGYLLSGLIAHSASGIAEEVGYRGYVFANLARELPVWSAAVLSGILFSVVLHANQPQFDLMFIVYATLLLCCL
ncbi:MAG: CPBP family glutamic-type intramembrane protease, partial [Egibacteraceae bacterium]